MAAAVLSVMLCDDAVARREHVDRAREGEVGVFVHLRTMQVSFALTSEVRFQCSVLQKSLDVKLEVRSRLMRSRPTTRPRFRPPPRSSPRVAVPAEVAENPSDQRPGAAGLHLASGMIPDFGNSEVKIYSCRHLGGELSTHEIARS